MANWFEDLTKTMADEKIGRRTAIRRVAGTVAGVAIASTLPGIALAKANKQCPNGGYTCNISYGPFCANSQNPNCICFTQINGKAVCGCNGYCSQLQTCKSLSDCPKGTFCSIENGCNCGTSSGVCITKCKGKNKNCQLGNGHGATVARVL